MANFGKISLTNAGVNTLVKAQAGNPIVFTKIKMGSGVEPDNISSLTDLVEVQLTAEIVKGTAYDNSYIVEAHFTNEGLDAGFYWKELGVYVKDSNGNDVLFGYANSGATADYIPATQSEIHTKHVRVSVAVGDVENITISNSKGTYVDIVTFTESLEEKVDKEAGKGLSTNDFTDEEKNKLANISDGANKYVLPTATGSVLGGIKSGGAITVKSDGTTQLNEHTHTANDITDLSDNAVIGVKGSSESSYRKGNVSITKANIGLGNVDNTSDKNKPVSDATNAALEVIRNSITTLSNKIAELTNAINNCPTNAELDAVRTDIEKDIENLDSTIDAEMNSIHNSVQSLYLKIGESTISHIADGKITGAIYALYEMVSAIPEITSGTSTPSGGSDGDVYIMHE